MVNYVNYIEEFICKNSMHTIGTVRFGVCQWMKGFKVVLILAKSKQHCKLLTFPFLVDTKMPAHWSILVRTPYLKKYGTMVPNLSVLLVKNVSVKSPKSSGTKLNLFEALHSHFLDIFMDPLI